jgi:Leucine-rich repeat (LRR) protein
MDKLVSLWCSENRLLDLYLGNISSLKNLVCQNNKLVELIIDNHAHLQIIDCSFNKLVSLTIKNSPNVQMISCNDNCLQELSYVGNELALLYCHFNKLSSLNLQTPNLQILDCFNNQFSKLNLNKYEKLYNLNCAHNKLTTLRIQKLFHLEKLYINDNKLTSLPVSNLQLSLLSELCMQNNCFTTDSIQDILIANIDEEIVHPFAIIVRNYQVDIPIEENIEKSTLSPLTKQIMLAYLQDSSLLSPLYITFREFLQYIFPIYKKHKLQIQLEEIILSSDFSSDKVNKLLLPLIDLV